MITTWFILARSLHMGSCLLFFGALVFDRFIFIRAGPAGQTEAVAYQNDCRRMFGLILLPTILLSGIAWLLLVAMDMSSLPFESAVQFKNLKMVWDQTQFGIVWRWRLLFWAGAVLVHAGTAIFKFEASKAKVLVWIQLLCAGLLLGSLAWAGHGQAGQPAGWHLTADVVHLITAGFWPTGLLPLVLLLHELSRTPDSLCLRAIALLVHRFSAVSLGAVLLLAATGLINSWFLVGSISNLLQQPYGRWLLLKISLFVLAVLIGGVNLLRLKPRILQTPDLSQNAAATIDQLKRNVQLELLLGTGIIIVVAILGILPPAIH